MQSWNPLEKHSFLTHEPAGDLGKPKFPVTPVGKTHVLSPRMPCNSLSQDHQGGKHRENLG
jgi:hypothetical protein